MLVGVWNEGKKKEVKNDSSVAACTTRDTEVPFTKMWETAGRQLDASRLGNVGDSWVETLSRRLNTCLKLRKKSGLEILRLKRQSPDSFESLRPRAGPLNGS